tara:strand:+ start:7407 stop:8513 length:1107 start_codon:yes stop_codon:yes gene_type:complete
MGVRLSHSQANKFLDCSQAWKYHYKDRIRPVTKSSALFFGNVLDSAVEDYLNNRDRDKSREIIKTEWSDGDINGVDVKLYSCTSIVYSNADYDAELLEDTDILLLTEEYDKDVLDRVKSIYKQKAVIGFHRLKKDDRILLNKANWLSMYRKGLLMLDEAIRLIDENVEEVLGTQIKVELDNGEGDSIVGYADFVVKWKGYDQPILFDLKTSSIVYKDDSVITSAQLSLYIHALRDVYKTDIAGYFVLNKRVKKKRVKICSECGHDGTGGRHKTCDAVGQDSARCGGAWKESLSFSIASQVIIDEPSSIVEDMVMNNMDSVAKGIKSEVITRNLSACEKPWGRCAYYELCYKKASLGDAQLAEIPEGVR